MNAETLEKSAATQRYVVEFLFDDTFSRVALIRKQKPKWQAGLLNGIGGKIEPGEYALDAMRREFAEEASYPAPSELVWKPFCSMSGVNNDGSSFAIEFFFSIGTPSWALSNESEPISVFSASKICAGSERTIGNLPWLVALAKDFGAGVCPPGKVEAEYFPKAAAY